VVGGKYFYSVLCSILLLITSQHLYAAQDDFKLVVTQKTVELGKPVWISITTNQQAPSLQTLDFSSLEKQFEVVKDKNEIHHTPKGQQWRIRLYPRRKGLFTLPALHFNQHTSRPINIQVGSPVDSKTGRPFEVDYRISNLEPWIKQQLLVTYTFKHHDSRLVLKPLASPDTAMMVIPLAATTQQQAGVFRHTSGWAIYARKSGKHSIKLPALHYIRDGVITHRFHPAKIDLDIKPLPAYLPGNIPVGKLSLDVIHKPDFILKSRLNSMTLALNGHGIPDSLLPDIRHFFKSHQQLNIYPVETHSQQTATSGVSSQHRYRIPFKATVQGSLSLPAVRLNYFDPVTGKLATIALQPQQTYSVAVWLLFLLLVMFSAASLLITGRLYRWFIPKWQCLRAYRHALQALPDTHTLPQFKSLATRLSLGEGWPGNLSLRQWVARHQPARAEQARQICLQLEAGLYRNGVCDPQKLRAMFKHLCLSRWSILAWSRPFI